MRNGSETATMAPANAPAGRAKLPRPPRLRSSIAAKKGMATSANCFSSTAAARQAAAQAQREPLAHTNASTRTKTRAAREPERETEEEEAGCVCRSEPGRLDGERVCCESRADRQPHGERPCER